jgi:hypothetical protein
MKNCRSFNTLITYELILHGKTWYAVFMEADFVLFYNSKSCQHWANILSSKPLAKQNEYQFNLKLAALMWLKCFSLPICTYCLCYFRLPWKNWELARSHSQSGDIYQMEGGSLHLEKQTFMYHLYSIYLKCYALFWHSYEDWSVDELIVEDSWKRQVGGE